MAMRNRTTFGLTGEEALGLFVAVLAHVALIAALVLSPLGRTVQPPPQRMTVTLSDTVADQSTSPKPDAQAAPDLAPDLGEPDHADQPLPPAPPPVAKPEPKPVPKPVARPVPKAEPKPVAKPKPEPKPEPEHKARPEPKHAARPEPKHVTRPEPKSEAKAESNARPDTRPRHEAKPEARPAGGSPRAQPHPAKPTGGSRIDSNFLAGIPGSTTPGTDKVSPGVKTATVSNGTLSNAITRQLLKPWTHLKPVGVDVDKFVAVLSWTLNPDGSLASEPVVITLTGITPSNRPQAALYRERAIDAVKRAAPFILPKEAYRQWKSVKSFRFDNTLSEQEKQ
jgi:hypothetical protein